MATLPIDRTLTTSQDAMPPVATVHRGPDGSLQHTRCARRLEFMGARAGFELDFYCYTCCEHITLNPYVVRRLPEPTDADVR